MNTIIYAPALHAEVVGRIQRVLDAGIALANQLGITDETEARGDLPDGSTVVLSHIMERDPHLTIQWRSEFVHIRHWINELVKDGTCWDGEMYRGGHIDYTYTDEQKDPQFLFDVCALLNQVTNWKVCPIPFID